MPLSGGSSGQAVATSQLVTATGNITAWGSIVTVTSASANTQTLPQCTLANIGKSITISNNGAGLVTTAAFAGDTLQNSRTLAQGEAITITVTAINLCRVVSDTVATPVITESLPAWAATTAVNASAERSTTIQGVLTGLSSKTTRTTTATFDATEGANWNYLSQSSVPAFVPSSLVLAGFQIVDSGQTFQANTTRVTGATFDTTEQLSWSALSSSATGTRINLSNFATSTSIGTAAATVDSATILTFTQTTANITVTIPSPTNVNVHKTISVSNLTTSTQPISVRGFAGVTDTITLGIGDVKEISWNGNGWRATSPVNVLGEYGTLQVNFQNFTTNTFVDSTNGIYTIPSAGVWKLRYDIVTDSTSVATVAGSMLAITDSSNNIIVGSEKARGGSTTVAQVLTAEVFVTTSGATTYKLRGRNGSAAADTFSILNNTSQDCSISWEKISGFLPVTGQIVDFIQSSCSAQSTNVGSGDHVKFLTTSALSGTGITLDAATAYTTTANAASLGRFTLKAGKTYKMSGNLGDIGYASASNSNYISYRWYNSDLNTPLGSQTTVNSDYGEQYDGAGGYATAIFTPTVDTRVELRINGQSGVTSYGGTLASSNPHADIVQIGSTAWTGLTLTTTGSGAATYNSSTSTLNIPSLVNDQTASGYIDIGNVRMQWGTATASSLGATYNLPAPFANTSYSITANSMAGGGGQLQSVNIGAASNSTFGATVWYSNGSPNGAVNTGQPFSWIAIGRKP